jgi:hypothetical protein
MNDVEYLEPLATGRSSDRSPCSVPASARGGAPSIALRPRPRRGVTYRIHLLSIDLTREATREVSCADDGEVMRRCCRMLAAHPSVEAWDGGRLVCRMSRAGEEVAA